MRFKPVHGHISLNVWGLSTAYFCGIGPVVVCKRATRASNSHILMARPCPIIQILPQFYSVWSYPNQDKIWLYPNYFGLVQFMRKRNHFSCSLKSTIVNRLHEFMRKRNHLNVRFVTTTFPEKVIWKSILCQFMRKRNLWDLWLPFFFKNIQWLSMFYQFMRKSNI